MCVAPSPSPSPEPQGGDENIGVIIGAVIGGIVGAILLILLLCCCCFVLAPWYKRDKVEEHETSNSIMHYSGILLLCIGPHSKIRRVECTLASYPNLPLQLFLQL